MSRILYEEAIIASGQSKSKPINIQDKTVVGIHYPVMDGATIKFETAKDDQSTFRLMRKGGDPYSIGIDNSNGGHEIIQPADLASAHVLKIVASENQGSSRTLYLVTRVID